MGSFEIFSHTADVGLRMRADSRDELFRQAALGLFTLIATNLDAVQPRHVVTYDIEGEQADFLLFDWLSELLFTFEAQHLLLSEFEVETDERGLKAVARGEVADPTRHHLEHEVKAITYHGLEVRETEGRWSAEVVVDI
ncbi:MAG: archease [Pirellulaceae bacterium]